MSGLLSARDCGAYIGPMEPDTDIQRSTYCVVPPGGDAGDMLEEPAPVPGHVQGRNLRISSISGSIAVVLLVTLAGATIWLGGARTGRHHASLRSQLGLQEHEDCKPFDDHVDYRGLLELERVEKVTTSKKCKELCEAKEDCAAWTWGKARNVFGFSDVCFLREMDPDQKVEKYSRYATVAGLRSGSPCIASVQESPAFVKGHIKIRDGFCLEAAAPVAGAKVAMQRCADGKISQEWVYVEKTGQVQNGGGMCLDAVDRSRPFVPLEMFPCNTGNWSQQWMYDRDMGIIKNWRGSCIEAAEPNIDGGQVIMQTCNSKSSMQSWELGATGDQKPLTHYPAGTLYCFALMLPDSYEQKLLAMQHQKKVSLFGCDEAAVYSNRVIEVDGGLVTLVVSSDLKCGKGGEFGTALNLDIFIAVWTKVISEGRFQEHDWTVKVDPDAVFFPDRLKDILTIHPEEKAGVYLNNCKFGMHGPLEVFSRNAVAAWATGSPRCVQHFQKQCGGDCYWGEDLFIDQCLWKVLGVRRDNDFRLLLEDHCEPPSDWDACTDGNRVAFHPFKSVAGYVGCLDNAGVAQTTTSTTDWPEPVALVLTPAPSHARHTPSHAGHGRHTPTQSPAASQRSHVNCHTSKKNERCWIAVRWAMREGIRQHPDWYHNLTVDSSWYDFQAELHRSPHVDCPMPCKSEAA